MRVFKTKNELVRNTEMKKIRKKKETLKQTGRSQQLACLQNIKRGDRGNRCDQIEKNKRTSEPSYKTERICVVVDGLKK